MSPQLKPSHKRHVALPRKRIRAKNDSIESAEDEAECDHRTDKQND